MFKLSILYVAAVVTFLGWVALAHVAIRCDRVLAAAWHAGERFDHVDDSLEVLEALHVQLFGREG